MVGSEREAIVRKERVTFVIFFFSFLFCEEISGKVDVLPVNQKKYVVGQAYCL